MTVREIQQSLIVEKYRRSFVLPNYTPAGWFECDVFELTSAGYFREYEIKMSRGDFFNDAHKKKRGAFDWVRRQYENRPTKHDMLEDCRTVGPRQFWFVVPLGLVKASEAPEWSGLFVAESRKNGRPPYSVRLNMEVEAPLLHSEKCCQKIAAHAKSVTYWRFLKAFIHNRFDAE